MASTQELIDYYADLLILQYSQKPKAYASVQATVTPVIMDQLPTMVLNSYTLGTAVGVQLDVIGKYAGVTRRGYGFNGPITLNDTDFATLIQMAIIKNTLGTSLASIDQLLNQFFPGEIIAFDYANMQMSYYLNSSIGSQDLAQMFITQGLLPKPLGVQLSSVIYSPVITTFFGFRTYDLPAYHSSPLNTYDSYNMTYPMLSYDLAVITS